MSTKLFTYTALDPDGARQTGVLQAVSRGAAMDELGKRGFRVEELKEGRPFEASRDPLTKNVLAPIFGRVNFESLQRFYAQLWSMYRAGVPLINALDTLQSTTSHPKLRHVIGKLKEYVLQGRPMSDCMAEYPEVFGELQTSLVRLGERGGALEQSLFHLKEYLAKEIQIRNKLKTATFHFKMMLAAIILIPLAANIVISTITSKNGGPQFSLFSFASLPIVIYSLVFVVLFWLVLGKLLMQQPPIRYVFHRALLLVPYLGGTVEMFAMAKFGRAFATMYGGGVPIGQALTMSANACGNDYIASKIQPASGWIQEGRPIAESLARTRVFPRITIDMAHTGEQSGNMEAMFNNVAEQFEDEADVRVEKLIRVLPVVLLIIAAIAVGYIVITFFTSYYSTLMESGGAAE